MGGFNFSNRFVQNNKTKQIKFVQYNTYLVHIQVEENLDNKYIGPNLEVNGFVTKNFVQ